jgi:hypothetical protein
MGAYLSQPNTEKHSEDGEGPGSLRYGVSEMQGWRMHMEVRPVGRCLRLRQLARLCYGSAQEPCAARAPHPLHACARQDAHITKPELSKGCGVGMFAVFDG